MQVIVKGHNVHVSDTVRDIATQKIEKVQRFFDKIQTMDIEFSEEHNPRIADKHTIEVTVTTKAHVLRAHAAGPDQHTAVDRVVDKLEGQVKRLKGRVTRRASKGGDRSEPRTRTVGATLVGSDEGVEPRITRETRFAVKPMTPEEAVLQMETLGHQFHLFIHAASERAAVVYRRDDGTFGMIQPE